VTDVSMIKLTLTQRMRSAKPRKMLGLEAVSSVFTKGRSR